MSYLEQTGNEKEGGQFSHPASLHLSALFLLHLFHYVRLLLACTYTNVVTSDAFKLWIFERAAVLFSNEFDYRFFFTFPKFLQILFPSPTSKQAQSSTATAFIHRLCQAITLGIDNSHRRRHFPLSTSFLSLLSSTSKSRDLRIKPHAISVHRLSLPSRSTGIASSSSLDYSRRRRIHINWSSQP